MTRRSMTLLALLFLSSCAAMKRDWEAQQAAHAEQQRTLQPTNVETYCKTLAQSYCQRCGQAGASCSETYGACLSGHSPAAASGFSVGQVEQCAAEIGQADCGMMGQAWPAACYPPESAAVAAAPSEPACEGGSAWNGSACTCPEGTGWNGTDCIAVATPVAANEPPPSRPSGKPSCRALVVQKGYGPSAAGQCQGAESFCAEAVLNAGYGPSSLANCKNVDGQCAVAVIQKGYGPSSLPQCRGVDRACALATLEKGYGPSSLANCKRRR